MAAEKLHWRAVERPNREPLVGRLVRLEPLDVGRDAPQLFAASHGADTDAKLWDWLFQGPFTDEASFTRWLEGCAASADPLFFTVVDQATGRAGGMVSYMRMAPEHGVIEIGNIWFGGALQRTPQATETIYLLARHVFDDLGYRRLEWKCDSRNARSRRAALRFGFAFEGLFREHMVVKDRNRDTTWFAMVDRDWPRIKAGFEAWLHPANFDAQGRQRRPLATGGTPDAAEARQAAAQGVRIVPVAPEHHAQWERLFAGYARFYEVEQTQEMRDRVWSWLMDPAHEVEGRVALNAEGRVVGLAHFRAFARPLTATIGGFLDDLFVDPEARGSGAAQALIRAVADIGRSRSWSVIRWFTADDNYRARSVYDREGARTKWVTYDIKLA